MVTRQNATKRRCAPLEATGAFSILFFFNSSKPQHHNLRRHGRVKRSFYLAFCYLDRQTLYQSWHIKYKPQCNLQLQMLQRILYQRNKNFSMAFLLISATKNRKSANQTLLLLVASNCLVLKMLIAPLWKHFDSSFLQKKKVLEGLII